MTWGIFKTDVVSEAYKKMKAEELKGKQHKLDVNKNGKIDGEDLAKLRKEDAVEEGWNDMLKDVEKRKKEADAADKFDKKKVSTGTVYSRKPAKDADSKTQKNEEVELEEANVSDYNHLGANKNTTHFLKNTSTGEIVSPHRSKEDAADAQVAAERDNKAGHTFKVVRAKHIKEEVELEEAINADDYKVTSEPSQFGGHRPKVVHKEKGTTMHLSQHAYKSPKHAEEHAKAYLTAYEKRGPNAADSAGHDYAKQNKQHTVVKEDVDYIVSEEIIYESTAEYHNKMANAHREHESAHTTEDENRRPGSDHFHAADHHGEAEKAHKHAADALNKHGSDSSQYTEAAKTASDATKRAKETSSTLKFRHVSKPGAIKEQKDLVKIGSKQIKHANMKDKQDDAEVMEPNSEGEADFIDKHVVRVTDDPAAEYKPGSDKVKSATKPSGKGPGSYNGDSKLSDKDKATYKEGASVEEECSSKKKTFSTFKKQMKD
jgi:hypothetical protein